MNQITKKNCIDLIKENFPKFIPYWNEHIKNFNEEEDEEEGLTIQLMPFEEYAFDIIKSNNENEIKKIFDFVEFLICNGDESVKNALTTSFLEYLLGKYPNELNFRPLVKYLGEQSIGYCRAWDEFCGVKTDGLWDDE